MLLLRLVAVSIVCNSVVLSFPSIPQIPSDKEPEEAKELVQYENEDVPGFTSGREERSWLKLFPDRFGDYFEIFSFFMHRKWHHEIIDEIQLVGDEVENVDAKLERLLQRADFQQQTLPITVKALLPDNCIRKSELLNVI